jgi:hypothetical protein
MYLRNFPYEAVEAPNSKPLFKDSPKVIERLCRKYGKVDMVFADWQAGKRMVQRAAA